MGRRLSRPLRPEWFHGAAALLLSLLGTAVLLWLARRHAGWYVAAAAWLASVNLSTVGYYGFDKSRARRGGRRVPEVVLHGLALIGGSPGAYLGMRLFRHKTIKGRFRLVFWAIVVAQVALAGWVGWLLWRRHG